MLSSNDGCDVVSESVGVLAGGAPTGGGSRSLPVASVSSNSPEIVVVTWTIKHRYCGGWINVEGCVSVDDEVDENGDVVNTI